MYGVKHHHEAGAGKTLSVNISQMNGVKHHHKAGEGKTTVSKCLADVWCETSLRDWSR